MEAKEQFVLIRYFNAPKERVFDAFAHEDAMAAWWGPAGMSLTIKSFDFEINGHFHYKMEGHGQTMWALFKYLRIERPDCIEFINSFSDEAGNICKAPFPIDLPWEIRYEITLVELGDQTQLTLKGTGVNASEAQIATYLSIRESMEEGFGGTFDQLGTYLA